MIQKNMQKLVTTAKRMKIRTTRNTAKKGRVPLTYAQLKKAIQKNSGINKNIKYKAQFPSLRNQLKATKTLIKSCRLLIKNVNNSALDKGLKYPKQRATPGNSSTLKRSMYKQSGAPLLRSPPLPPNPKVTGAPLPRSPPLPPNPKVTGAPPPPPPPPNITGAPLLRSRKSPIRIKTPEKNPMENLKKLLAKRRAETNNLYAIETTGKQKQVNLINTNKQAIRTFMGKWRRPGEKLEEGNRFLNQNNQKMHENIMLRTT